MLVDLICHGVPSVELLRKHVHKVAKFPHYDNVIFRENSYIVVVVVVGGRVVYRQPFNKPRYKDWDINSFFDGYTYRDSCYQCRYACPERISDITIGDFWGLGKSVPADEIPPHPNGCSVVLPNSDKGKEVILQVSEKMNLYKRAVDEAVGGNDQLRHPCPFGRRKKLFRFLFPYIGASAYRLVMLDRYLRYNIRRIARKILKK